MAKPSWVTLDKSSGTGGGSVRVTAASNTRGRRSGNVIVRTASGLTKSIEISQNSVPNKFNWNFWVSLEGADSSTTVQFNNPSITIYFADGTRAIAQSDIVSNFKSGDYKEYDGTSEYMLNSDSSLVSSIMIQGITFTGSGLFWNVELKATLYDHSTENAPIQPNVSDKNVTISSGEENTLSTGIYYHG